MGVKKIDACNSVRLFGGYANPDATALILLLTGFQAVTLAQPSKASPPADRQAMHDEMQEKMASAKTDEERQQIMADQHKKAQALHGPMHAQMHAHMGHSARGPMKDMPLGDAEHLKRCVAYV